MLDIFHSIVHNLIKLSTVEDTSLIFQDIDFSAVDDGEEGHTLWLINTAFLIILTGDNHPASNEAREYLRRISSSNDVGLFYLNGLLAIESELQAILEQDQDIAKRMEILADQISEQSADYTDQQLVEMFWSFFHPEATGIWDQEESRITELREKRKIRITKSNPDLLTDPARQVLFTSNALLTLPSEQASLDELRVDDRLKNQLSFVTEEPQLYWYDHPIQIGVAPEENEVLYGLRGLQEALDFERRQDNLSEGDQLTCVLSVSVTHTGLHGLARKYLTAELRRGQPLPGLNIFVFTEDDCQELIREVLAPAASHYLGEDQADEKLRVFGVDGEYGRHYTFLKAIAALWNVLIDPQIKATFKIDLDQVFPQKELHETTGLSAFEHLKSPLWGASGLDANDQPVELGMIAGALVNEDDLQLGLFTPDVPVPPSAREFSPDEWVFFSQLPQALSTEAEMMARYERLDLDGVNTCLQRVHVTGGTNGILVKSLKRFRPFTPSFIGRAEDQAYILSTLAAPGKKLAYLHQSGLIMRHDKQAFAQEAIQAAQVGKLIGDYVRILYFSAYARALEYDFRKIKDRLDPFTGSFISYVPTTMTLLRFALKAEGFFKAGQSQHGAEFLKLGSQRINQALKFVNTQLHQQYHQERQGWELYYEILLALEKHLQEGDQFAEDLRLNARRLTRETIIQFEDKQPLDD